MGRLGVGLCMATAIAGVLVACGSGRLPAPPYVGQPTAALQPVSYPPPPARVELVPAAPNASAVWIDGEWTWQGLRWSWKRGRWVAPPEHASYAPWTSVRDTAGNLYVAEGKWRDEQGRELPDPEPIATARSRGGKIVNAEGEDVQPGPTQIADAGDASD